MPSCYEQWGQQQALLMLVAKCHNFLQPEALPKKILSQPSDEFLLNLTAQNYWELTIYSVLDIRK